jgi:hypothetical protein
MLGALILTIGSQASRDWRVSVRILWRLFRLRGQPQVEAIHVLRVLVLDAADVARCL